MSELDDPPGAVASLALAPMHNAWLGTITGIRDVRSEPKATCNDCVMCAGVERSGSQMSFSPDTKCCTYVPHLANFIAGQSLLGPGRAGITARIERKSGVTPLGLGLSHDDLRVIVGQRSHFGRSPVVVCPHFMPETHGCGIWQTRNAVCSTWFCQHDRGALTQRFWQAVRDLLIAIEERLAERCLAQGALPDSQVRHVLDHRAGIRAAVTQANSGALGPDAAPDDESTEWYLRMWGDWAGREQDWFRRSAEFARAVTPDELLALVRDTPHLTQAVKDSWHDLSVHDVPDRPHFTPGPGSEATPTVLRLIGYSPFDPLVLPASLQADLFQLDGRPRAQVTQYKPFASDTLNNNAVDDIILDDNLLTLLHDYGLLAPPE